MTEELKKLAKEIIFNFKNYYLNKYGLISRHFPPDQRTIFDNFDDIAPFFIYFNETDFLLDQILKLKEKFSFEKILAYGNLIYSYRIDEFIGGLYCLWRKTKNEEIKNFLDQSINKINRYFIYKNNIYGTYDIESYKKSKHYYYWSSGLLETFLEMSTDYPSYQNIVKDIVNNWLNNRFFCEYHLFPYRWSENLLIYYINLLSTKFNQYSSHQPQVISRNILSFIKKKVINTYFNYFTSGFYVQLMKSNTTFIFTLIELYRKTKVDHYKKVIIRWIDSVQKKMIKDGNVYGFFYPNGSLKDPSLANSFIFIDVLLDTYYFIERDDNYLKLAEILIDKQLSFQWENNLIPMVFNGNLTHIDNLVDFSITIRRYGELSGDTSYLKHSIEIMKNTLKYHQGKHGYYTHINKLSKPIHLRINTIDPKYNGLLLKGIINLMTIREKMYGNEELHDIFKDR